MDILKKLGELALGSRFKRISDRLMQDCIRIYRERDLEFEPRWFPMFALFYHYPGTYSVTEIAKSLGVSHVSINQMSKEMIKKGVLCSKKDDKDKRKSILELTTKGKSLANDLQKIWESIYVAAREITHETGYDIMDVLGKLEEKIDEKSLYERFTEQSNKRNLETVEILEYSDLYKRDFAELNYEWLEKYFYVEEKDREVLENPEREIIAKGGFILFAKYGDQIVGTCALIKHSKHKYELAKMAVTEKMQGKQIGKKLALAVTNKAEKLGAESIFLETNSRLISAVNLYRKIGFKVNSEIKTSYERGNLMMTKTFS